MFPIGDDNPTFRRPVITWALIATNVTAWVVVEGAGSVPALPRAVCELGLIPGELLGRVPAGTTFPVGGGLACQIEGSPNLLSPLSSMFLHGGWLHLLGNLWFLWIFGNNVEDSMGHLRYLAFYLLTGLAAAAGQVGLEPSSLVPMVGASGAISGIMGAYIVLYPRVRVHMFTLLVVLPLRFDIPAFLMLGYWIGLQLLGGMQSLGSQTGGVAYWAHTAGFVAGALLVFPFRNAAYVAEHRALARTI